MASPQLTGFTHAHSWRRPGSAAHALQLAAMSGYLRHCAAPLRVIIKRLPASVAAKQNGFWQLIPQVIR